MTRSLDRLLVELVRLALLDGDRALRALAQARAEAVAVALADQPRLAVHDLDRALGAGVRALAAAGALRLVNLHNLSLHRVILDLIHGKRPSRRSAASWKNVP